MLVEWFLLAANQLAAANYRYLEALCAAGIYYLGLTTIFMVLQALLQRFLGATADAGRVR